MASQGPLLLLPMAHFTTLHSSLLQDRTALAPACPVNSPCVQGFGSSARLVARKPPPGQGRLLATSEEKTNAETTPFESENSSSAPSDKKAEAREVVKKGQTTAIITGAIAVILGVAYLILVQLLDSRGVNLVPPPPEAFEP